MSRSLAFCLAAPVRRAATVATCSVLSLAAAGAPALAGGTAPARSGTSGAAVLRADLDVTLLDGALRVPVTVPVNEVRAPGSSEKTALTVLLDGVAEGRPITVFRADAATARASAEPRRTDGYAHLARARVYVPGLPSLPLVEVEGVTSRAVCRVGARPVASSDPIGAVSVLGRRVPLGARRATEVPVPGVGTVTLAVAKSVTTARTAASSALDLRVSVNPLRRNVAEVTGRVTLAEATCTTPGGPRT